MSALSTVLICISGFFMGKMMWPTSFARPLARLWKSATCNKAKVSKLSRFANFALLCGGAGPTKGSRSVQWQAQCLSQCEPAPLAELQCSCTRRARAGRGGRLGPLRLRFPASASSCVLTCANGGRACRCSTPGNVAISITTRCWDQC